MLRLILLLLHLILLLLLLLLILLLPPRPPPPIQDTYSMFGVTINNDDAIIQSLESQVSLENVWAGRILVR